LDRSRPRSGCIYGGLGRAAGLAFAALTATPVPAAADLKPRPCILEPGPTRSVAKVLDGETLGLDDGSEVRLIGALSPRPPGHGAAVTPWPPAQAAQVALAEIALGRSVDLAYPAGPRLDRYGRHLAHVFVHTGDGRTWVQGQMLEQGHARAYRLPTSAGCMGELLAHEQLARERVAGLWSHAAYQMRAAARTRELLALRGTFQIVEGRVASANEVRGRIYLNFGADWRDDFTVTLKAEQRRGLSERGIDALALAGRRVRVRGWIDRRGGPAIDLADAAELEVMDVVDVPSPPAEPKPEETAPTQERPAENQPAAREL
jgi:endonuclease YncB( thermonuclease family)